VLQRESLRQLLSQIVPDERVDPLVEAFLLDVADDFVDSVVAFACKLAAHRKSDTLEVKDIVLHLERAWDMVLPGFETEELREFKPPPEARAHKKRMADVRRELASAAAAEAETVLAREKEREEEKEKGDPEGDGAEGAKLDASKADADAS
jgi:transcription initiation factor TFIID subunit 12